MIHARFLILGFSILMAAGCAAKGQADLSSVYAGLHSISPDGSYTYTATSITCTSACTMVYDANSNFLSKFGLVNCAGNLTVTDTSLACSAALQMTK